MIFLLNPKKQKVYKNSRALNTAILGGKKRNKKHMACLKSYVLRTV